MNEHTATRRKYLVLILLLLLLLVGLIAAYRLFLRPPLLVGESVDREGYRQRFSLYGFGADRLSRPSDVAFGADGRIYVADTFNHRVVVYDGQGRYLDHFGERGAERFQLEYPSGLAIAPDGRLFVLCKDPGKVVVFDASFEPIWEIYVESPQVATVKDGRLYLATERGIMIGDLDGTIITAFGRRGGLPGEVDHPGGLVVGDDGTIYVSDSLNYRVQAIGDDGKMIWAAGSAPGDGDGLRNRARRFGLPAGLAIGADGLLYLVDAFTGTLQVLDTEDGTELARYGEWGHEEGMLYYPAGIDYGGGATFAVADKFNDRVQVFDVDSPIEAPLARLLRSPYPWLLPLALLPLLLLFVRRRFPADQAFLETLVAQGAVDELAGSVPRVEVSSRTREVLSGSAPETGLDDLMKSVSVRGRKVARLMEKHGLDDEQAILLARAKRSFFLPAVLLTDDGALRAAAAVERVERLSSREVLDHWGYEATRAPAIAESGGPA